MLNLEKLNEFSNKIKDIAKESPLADIEKNTHALLKSALTKMELISREEFDIQTEVLRKTQAKLAELEIKLAQLEAAQPSETTTEHSATKSVS